MKITHTAPDGALLLIPSTVIQDGARQLGYGTFIYPGQWPMRFRFAYVDMDTPAVEDDGELIAGWDFND